MAMDDILGDDLLAVAAHDLKSPISAVRGYIELVQQTGDLNETQMRYCGRALAGLERMEDLISALLELSKLESGGELQFADCDLGAITLNAIDMVESVAGQRAVSIFQQIEMDAGIVSGEPRLLGEVLINLLTNAIKYNRDGGSVWVTVSNQPEFVRVDVRDDGVGIPEADQSHVFDRFFRAGNSAETRAAGSGLGLAIVRSIIQKHQGYIWVKSVPGAGSTFSFTIPRIDHLNHDGAGFADSGRRPGEGQDMRHHIYHEVSIEDVDDIDDNTQESPSSDESDSSSDVV